MSLLQTPHLKLPAVSVILAALALALAPTTVGAEPRASDALDRGEVLVYPRARPGRAEPQWVMKAVINAPPARIWSLLADCAGYGKIMPRIKAARVDRRGARSDVCTVTVDMPFPYADLTSTGRSTYHRRGPSRIRRWRQLSGDYVVNEGEWRLTPFRGDLHRTLVVYRVEVLPRAWIPAWIRRAAQRRTLPRTIEMIRRAAATRVARSSASD